MQIFEVVTFNLGFILHAPLDDILHHWEDTSQLRRGILMLFTGTENQEKKIKFLGV